VTPPSGLPWTGDLIVDVACAPAGAEAGIGTHRVVIHQDLTVATSHDLALERVASALGAERSSCLDLADRVLPALRDALPLLARTELAPVERGRDDRWRILREHRGRCCDSMSALRVRPLAEHARSAAHLADVHDLALDRVAELIAAMEAAHLSVLEAAEPAARYVREPGGLSDLWRAGIHPDRVPALAAWASPVVAPLPTSYFEALAYATFDPGWLAGVLRVVPDPDVAAWLAAYDRPMPAPDAARLGRWLATGAAPYDAEQALGFRLDPDAVPDVAAATGWSLAQATETMVAWARIGCRPTARQFGGLARRGRASAYPSARALGELHDEVRRTGAAIDRSELGVMLAASGSRTTLLAAVRAGARRASELADVQFTRVAG
jgi:hypothetical protein